MSPAPDRLAAATANLPLSGLSCPHQSPDPAFLALLAVEHAREYTRRFLDLFSEPLFDRAPELASFLQAWLSQPQEYNATTFDMAWDLSFAGVRLAVLEEEDDSDALRRAATLGLWLGMCGNPGNWRVDFMRPQRLPFGLCRLPRAKSLEVSIGKRIVDIRGGSRPIRLTRGASAWKVAGAREFLSYHGRRVNIRFLPPTMLEGADGNDEFVRARVSGTRVVQCCEKALGLLDRHSPVYLPWVRQVIRYIVPIHSEASMIRSGSSFNDPGLVHMSFPAKPAALAEMLVHESSHQYYQLARHLGEVDDGSDRNLYYSPVRQMGRPLRFILMAYHAFANVLLFYRDCLTSGVEDGDYCQQNEEDLIPQLEQLEAPLRSTDALTAIGRSLWEPLAARIW